MNVDLITERCFIMGNDVVVKLDSNRDLKGFMECVNKLRGSAKAVQGDTIVDARSTLGIASMMVNGTFQLIMAPDNDRELFSKWMVG